MGRIRTIKPDFFSHEELFEAEVSFNLPLRVAFAGLWCQADREGRFKWRPRSLKTHVLPYDQVDFSRVLDALATRGFIRKYRVDGVDYGFIPTFLEHQNINNKESKSTLPQPTESNTISTRHERDDITLFTREDRDSHATSGERKGKEGKGREGERRVDDAPPHQADTTKEVPPPAESTVDRLIAAFDASIVHHWGDNHARLARSSFDKVYASDWLSSGRDLQFIIGCVEALVQKLKGKYPDRPPPFLSSGGLKVFRDDMPNLLAQPKVNGNAPPSRASAVQDPENMRKSQDFYVSEFRQRLDTGVGRLWNPHLGKPPGTKVYDPECKIPIDILAKHGFPVPAKTEGQA